MKKISIFELAIIGLLIGVTISTYLTYLQGTDGFIGSILATVSLKHLLQSIVSTGSDSLIVPFFFYIAVYIAYAIIVGFIIRSSRKATVAFAIVAVLVGTGSALEQVNGAKTYISQGLVPDVYVASVIKSAPKAPEKYFGTEARGDLNSDGKDDIAFIIAREDDETERSYYYVSASLKTNEGYNGTNLLYLGSGVIPSKISITDGIIHIEYPVISDDETTTSTSTINVHIVGDSLKEYVEPHVDGESQ